MVWDSLLSMYKEAELVCDQTAAWLMAMGLSVPRSYAAACTRSWGSE